MCELLNVEQVAKQFGFNTKSIYQLVYRGSLPFVKLGDGRFSPIRFRQEDIDKYIADHTHRTIQQQFSGNGAEGARA